MPSIAELRGMPGRPALVILFMVLIAGIATLARAQSGGDYDVQRSVIAGGGGRSSGGDFQLTGSIGQAEADPIIAQGTNFSLQGGFWYGSVNLDSQIFSDGFE